MSDSQVDYGTTASYVQSSGINSSLVTSHAVALASLAPSTLYHYRVKSNAGGNLAASADQTFTTAASGGDITPPSIPAGLSASAISPSQINLSWTASMDPDNTQGQISYRVYRGGNLIATTIAGATTYADSGLSASTNYSYTVAAVDPAGNSSGQSASTNATTQAASGGGWTDLTNTALRASATNYACPPPMVSSRRAAACRIIHLPPIAPSL